MIQIFFLILDEVTYKLKHLCQAHIRQNQSQTYEDPLKNKQTNVKA